jgi:hypothetical protein
MALKNARAAVAPASSATTPAAATARKTPRARTPGPTTPSKHNTMALLSLSAGALLAAPLGSATAADLPIVAPAPAQAQRLSATTATKFACVAAPQGECGGLWRCALGGCGGEWAPAARCCSDHMHAARSWRIGRLDAAFGHTMRVRHAMQHQHHACQRMQAQICLMLVVARAARAADTLGGTRAATMRMHICSRATHVSAQTHARGRRHHHRLPHPPTHPPHPPSQPHTHTHNSARV